MTAVYRKLGSTSQLMQQIQARSTTESAPPLREKRVGSATPNADQVTHKHRQHARWLSHKAQPKAVDREGTRLVGTRPDAEVAELLGRTFGTVWQKRRALGIPQPVLRFRKWTLAKDKLVGTVSDAEVALSFDRTETAVKSRRAILEREQAKRETKPVISNPSPSPAVLEALGVQPIRPP